MSRFWIFFTILFGAGLLAATGWPEPAEKDIDYGRSSLHRSIRWVSPSEERVTGGLYLFEATRAGTVTRILAQDPRGRPVIVTSILDARRGRLRTDLLDDETGWWARIKLETGVTADYLGEFFEAAGKDLKLDSGRIVGLTLVTRDGLLFERELALGASQEKLHRDFAAALREAGLADPLVAAMPKGLGEALLFLDTSMDQEASSVVEVLADIFRQASGVDVHQEEAEPWVMTLGDVQKGSGLVDPALIEFVSRFQSVENVDPLSDHRVDEILSNPKP